MSALDLDAIEARAQDLSAVAFAHADTLGLVREVRRLRAKVAAVEAAVDALTTAAKIERMGGRVYVAEIIEAIRDDLRAALATGEGK